ncbi:uncharacterized protein LOC134778900 [Penaeus indicus]|uniref:uncharacterized protein LOC134778900 n=1 Tax=Penaeus indicus TaxID=29960 RepID=UPI00300DB81B
MRPLAALLLFLSLSLPSPSFARGPPTPLRIPVVESLIIPAEDMTTLTLIEESFQPLVVPGSLPCPGGAVSTHTAGPSMGRKPDVESQHGGRHEALPSPWWFFKGLETSLEAATTFCVVDVQGEEEGERKRRPGMKRKAEKLVGGERDDRRGHEEKGAKKGEENNCGDVPEKEREKEGKKENREEEVIESHEGPKTLEMSLRRFALEGSRRWSHAVANISQGIGTSIPIPTLLADADFEFLDMRRTHLHHARAGWGGHVTQREGHDVTTAVVCALEGQLQFLLSPFSLPWQFLQCGADECLLQVPSDGASDEGRPEVFLARAQVLPDSCLYMPQGWQWQVRAEEDTTFLWLAWQDDLVLRDDVIAALLPPDEDDQGRGGEDDHAQRGRSAGGKSTNTRTGAKKGKSTGPATLWEILPTDPLPPLVLWGEQDPLPHLLGQYLLSGHQLSFDAFYERFRIDSFEFLWILLDFSELLFILPDCSGLLWIFWILLEFSGFFWSPQDSSGFLWIALNFSRFFRILLDRLLLPDLVDCPPECQALAASIFSLLDASADGLLNQLDATYLTRASVRSLTQQLDDLLDELRDMGTEQWVHVVQGDSGPREAFLGRAKDRMVSSAQSQVRRWIDGDLEGADEEALKEHLPELFSQVVAARENTDGKEEL